MNVNTKNAYDIKKNKTISFIFLNIKIYIRKDMIMRKYKTYTITSLAENIPFLRLSGKWLETKGFHIGDKLQLIECNNMIILVKLTQEEVKKINLEKQLSLLEKQKKQLLKQ